jgi:hypothetical protein
MERLRFLISDGAAFEHVDEEAFANPTAAEAHAIQIAKELAQDDTWDGGWICRHCALDEIAVHEATQTRCGLRYGPAVVIQLAFHCHHVACETFEARNWGVVQDLGFVFGAPPQGHSLAGAWSPSAASAHCRTKSPLRNSSTACSCATGSSPATTVATITSQRSLKASDSTDFADGAPTL